MAAVACTWARFENKDHDGRDPTHTALLSNDYWRGLFVDHSCLFGPYWSLFPPPHVLFSCLSCPGFGGTVGCQPASTAVLSQQRPRVLGTATTAYKCRWAVQPITKQKENNPSMMYITDNLAAKNAGRDLEFFWWGIGKGGWRCW